MKKLKILGSALAAVMGVSGAVYGHSIKQQSNHYKLVGASYRMLQDAYNPNDCDSQPNTTCVYLIESNTQVIPASSVTDAESIGEGSYTGATF